MKHASDTIAALSTALGEAGIAVVRISGPHALGLLDAVLRTPLGERFGRDWEHRRIYRADFVDAHGERVDDVMVKEPVCGDPDQTIDELRELMTLHHVRYLPVMAGERLLGIVSFHDVAKAVIKETSMENRLLRRYIESQPSDRPQ